MTVRRSVTAAVAVLFGVGLFAAGTAVAVGRTALNGKASESRVVPAFTAAAVKVKGAAVVNPDGSLARGSTKPLKAKGSTLASTGTYYVSFSGNITGCADEATIGLSGSSGASTPGFVTVVGLAFQPDALFIQTYNSSGALTDEGFHLIVVC